MILLHNLHVDVKNVTEMMLNVTCDLLKYITFFPLSNFFDIITRQHNLHVNVTNIKAPSMSFYLDFILILS
jgi:hypothetical protein